jgi:hypothetical protein
MQSERTGIENKWYALTGRVVELKVEEDGDLHIALHDATGDKAGVVVCEIPAKPQWCEIRTTVFSWTPTRLPQIFRFRFAGLIINDSEERTPCSRRHLPF